VKVNVYLPGYNEKLKAVLEAFAEGIPGAELRAMDDYAPSDIAVIFGLVKDSYPQTWPKREILERHEGRSLIVVESAFTLRGQYYAIGFGGIHGGADFRNEDSPNDRWQQMRVRTKRWQRRPKGAPVIVCGQLPRDTNVQETDHIGWVNDTVDYYLERDIPVRFRPHPRIHDPRVYGIPEALWDQQKLGKTLKEARCVVTWNSTTGVDALIAGVPVIACGYGSVSRPMASDRLDPDFLRFPSRRQFFANLGYAQWTLDEMREGLPWRHLTR